MQKAFWLALYLLWLPCLNFGQGLQLDLEYHCLYTGREFPATPYPSGNIPKIRQMVEEICKVMQVDLDFTVQAASIPSVASIRNDRTYTLLYSNRYTRNLLAENQVLLYAVLAHEIGHIAGDHQLEDNFRVREESAADLFMGKALYRLPAVSVLNTLLSTVRSETFAYGNLLDIPTRENLISQGWNAADAFFRLNDNLGFWENRTNFEKLPLPAFKLQGCPEPYDFPRNYFDQCVQLRDLDSLLKVSLQLLGYQRLAYYHVPNGFALVTPVEQIDKQGHSLPGQERWQDYPAGGKFESILTYLAALILPKPGYFRLFVFVVSDQPTGNYGQELNAQDTKDWLRNGGQWLPASIGRKDLSENHHMTLLVFEFEASRSKDTMMQLCNKQLFPVKVHLETSGIIQRIRAWTRP